MRLGEERLDGVRSTKATGEGGGIRVEDTGDKGVERGKINGGRRGGGVVGFDGREEMMEGAYLSGGGG